MNFPGARKKNYVYYLLFYLLLWILLFEFILPVNQILPKPSIVIESFDDLWRIYSLPENYLSTVAVVYVSIALAYLSIFLLKRPIIKRNNFISDFILSLEWFSEYIPGIMMGLLLIYWFPNSEYIEFLFAFLTAFFSLMIRIQRKVKNIDSAYIDAARSLGAKESDLIDKIEWPILRPKLFTHLFPLHFYIWSMLLAFEYIKGGLGIGVIFRDAINVRDISAIFSVFIITGLTIYLGNLAINYFSHKFYPSETE